MNIRRNKMQNIIILIEADGLPVCRVVAVGAAWHVNTFRTACTLWTHELKC